MSYSRDLDQSEYISSSIEALLVSVKRQGGAEAVEHLGNLLGVIEDGYAMPVLNSYSLEWGRRQPLSLTEGRDALKRLKGKT